MAERMMMGPSGADPLGRHRGKHTYSVGCDVDPKCKPVEEKKPERPLVKGPLRLNGGQYMYHRGVHAKTAGCDTEPACTPVDNEESEEPMTFEIETWYTASRRWTYRVKTERSGYTLRDDGYDSRDEAKRAAETRADDVAKAAVKPETYTYEGKLT